jgi:2-polyprenyl-6-hydroxyphenyl methylase / 3-demethylubiquinone-9 3-methyltransferase
VRQANLTAVRMAGMQYNPFTKVYGLSNDASVNYLMATRK